MVERNVVSWRQDAASLRLPAGACLLDKNWIQTDPVGGVDRSGGEVKMVPPGCFFTE